MASYTSLDDSQSWSSHDVLFVDSPEQERKYWRWTETGLVVAVLVMNIASWFTTAKHGTDFLLGILIAGYAVCLHRLGRGWRNGDFDPKYKYDLIAQMGLFGLLCFTSILYYSR